MLTYLRRTELAALVVLAALASTAASCPKAKTPEGTIALYGGRIAATVGAAQEAIGAVGKASTNQAVRNGAVAALQGLQVVNAKGLELADALDKIHQIRAAGGAVSEVSVQNALALLDAIDAAIDLEVIPKLGDHPETKAAIEAARAVGKLVLSIQFELGRLKS